MSTQEKRDVTKMSIKEATERIEHLSTVYTEDSEQWLDVLEEIEEISGRLAGHGIIDTKRSCLFDAKTCKYAVIDHVTNEVDYRTTSEKTFQKVAESFYRDGRVSENYAKFVPSKSITFDPHAKKEFRSSSNEQMINIFRESDYLKLDHLQSISKIDWNEYPTMNFLFNNVFHEHKDKFINWLAYGVQYRKKTGVSWVSKGEKGTGKGMIWEEVIQPLFNGYTREIGDRELEDKFNDWQDNKLFIVANEISIDYDKATKTANSIKIYITSPLVRSETKNLKAEEKRTYYNMWFHTNEKNPFIVERGDRRLNIVETKGKLELIEGFDYWKTLKNLKKELHDFLVDISMLKVDVKQACTVFHTTEKEESIEMNMTSMEFLRAKVEDNAFDELEDLINSSIDDDKIHQADANYVLQGLIDGMLDGKQKVILHLIITGRKASVKKIGNDFNGAFGKATQTRINGKRSYRTTFKAMYPVEID